MAESNNGNWHTAHRWANFLSNDCDIALLPHWPPASLQRTPQAMVALHARRLAASIRAWAEAWPGKPLIVVLTGTDLYRDIHTDAEAQQSLALATHLVVLQNAGLAKLPEAWRKKTRVIYQSAPALKPADKATHRLGALSISGNIGMLGESYASYFSPGDDAQLAALVRRCAAEPDFLALPQSQCNTQASLFSRQQKKRLVINLLARALGGLGSLDSLRDPPSLPFSPLKAFR